MYAYTLVVFFMRGLIIHWSIAASAEEEEEEGRRRNDCDELFFSWRRS